MLGGDPTMWGASVCLSARHTDTGEREPLHVKKADTLTPRKPAKHRAVVYGQREEGRDGCQLASQGCLYCL